MTHDLKRQAQSVLANPRPDRTEWSGAVESKAEEGVDAERRRLTTTREAAVPDHSGPGAGLPTRSGGERCPIRGVRRASFEPVSRAGDSVPI